MNKKLKKLIDKGLVTVDDLEQGIELLEESGEVDTKYYLEAVEYGVCEGDCGVRLRKIWSELDNEEVSFDITVRDYKGREYELIWDNIDYFHKFDVTIEKQRETVEELRDKQYRHPEEIVKTLIRIVKTGALKNFLERK